MRNQETLHSEACSLVVSKTTRLSPQPFDSLPPSFPHPTTHKAAWLPAGSLENSPVHFGEQPISVIPCKQQQDDRHFFQDILKASLSCSSILSAHMKHPCAMTTDTDHTSVIKLWTQLQLRKISWKQWTAHYAICECVCFLFNIWA